MVDKSVKFKRYSVKFQEIGMDGKGWNIEQYVEAPNKDEAKKLALYLVNKDFPYLKLELVSCERATP